MVTSNYTIFCASLSVVSQFTGLDKMIRITQATGFIRIFCTKWQRPVLTNRLTLSCCHFGHSFITYEDEQVTQVSKSRNEIDEVVEGFVYFRPNFKFFQGGQTSFEQVDDSAVCPLPSNICRADHHRF